MRNHFSTLHDMIMKNYEKIKTPRNSNMEHLYWFFLFSSSENCRFRS